MTRRAGALLAVAVLLAAAGVVAGVRWWHYRAPYGPEALNATATLRLDTPAAGTGEQTLHGQVAWDRPPAPHRGAFWIVVLDKRSQLKPGFLTASSARPGAVSTGSDDSLDEAQERYPWLRGAGTREIDGTFWSTGSAVHVASVQASPVTFESTLPPASPAAPPGHQVATAPAAVADLMVALISVGPSGQVYWAQRLLH
ncbi:hypothetical protein AB0F81_48945 [Actinoplanes sp. NPDC024001]|uniref:hypothetical protein n=1 Tax=Actinoplanes sp. NPDC024001 TaxID=3154598 RepID=UPI003403B5C2